jgi:phosphatidylethanolamine-binding protein (PEBP) family uncharacterized protein
VHWVVYGTPAAFRKFPEGVATGDTVVGIGNQGMNDFREIGYGGPVRREARPTVTSLSSRKTADLLKATQGHMLSQAERMGRYRRRSREALEQSLSGAGSRPF